MVTQILQFQTSFSQKNKQKKQNKKKTKKQTKKKNKRKNTGPIEAKFHVEPPWNGGMNICSNGPGHMTNMATMPIYGKNKSSLELKRPMTLKVSENWSTTKFVQMMILGLPKPILRQGQIWSFMLL